MLTLGYDFDHEREVLIIRVSGMLTAALDLTTSTMHYYSSAPQGYRTFAAERCA